MRRLRLLFCCLTFALPFVAQAQNGGEANVDSVRKFVQGFYDWYVPTALSSGSVPAPKMALRVKGRCFSPELERKLREDSEAQAKAKGEIVGLDFDPFLYSQDEPAMRYRAGKVLSKGKSYLVVVHGVFSGNPDETLTVTAEVARKNGQWYFANFLYPDGHTLLGVLKALKADRDKPARKPRCGLEVRAPGTDPQNAPYISMWDSGRLCTGFGTVRAVLLMPPNLDVFPGAPYPK